ncbi:hypothetical protein DCO48_17340 [Pseudomonas sp. SDI]|uniref:hypothetical protein n=1 Tax=Pseudomonas sp. SDI TaxID=2170734 RepID=UPI000DE63392|nr:hypothetical protein [Pseudomonas sp. SDI]PWB31423.1 hypothetical protein DCO48_17340 [Pseudomonas sp. SDI]
MPIESKLTELLLAAAPEDIKVLVDHLTDQGNGRLALAAAVRTTLAQAWEQRRYTRTAIELIVHEIKLFGGNSLVNLVRRDGVSYEEVVRDVADHLGLTQNKDDSITTVERRILVAQLDKGFTSMTEAEHVALLRAAAEPLKGSTYGSASGFGFDALKSTLKGSSIAGAAAAMVPRVLVANPIGAAVLGVAGVHGLAKQAYRITVPCVTQIAYLRYKGGQA